MRIECEAVILELEIDKGVKRIRIKDILKYPNVPCGKCLECIVMPEVKNYSKTLELAEKYGWEVSD